MNIDTSLSALSALSAQMNVTANNVANANTDGFKSSSVTLESGNGPTVKAAVSKNNTPGALIAIGPDGSSFKESSNVDLVKEMTQLASTTNSYDANLKMIEANIETRGTLINMVV